MAKRIKQIEMPKQTFTTVNTEVDAILEELVDWILTKSDGNLELEKEPAYKPTTEEEMEILLWLEQDKKTKRR
jgi:hypothetical protein